MVAACSPVVLLILLVGSFFSVALLILVCFNVLDDGIRFEPCFGLVISTVLFKSDSLPFGNSEKTIWTHPMGVPKTLSGS
jgi:hypothetical protein